MLLCCYFSKLVLWFCVRCAFSLNIGCGCVYSRLAGICICFIGRGRVRPTAFGAPSLAVKSVAVLGIWWGKKGDGERGKR